MSADAWPVQAEDERAIRRELLAVLLGHTRTALAGNVVIGCTSAVVLWASGVRGALPLWCAVLAALLVARGLHSRGLRPQVAQLDDAGLARAERQLTLLLAASGLNWGLLPWLSYTGVDPAVDLFTVAMLVGMTSGSVISSAALPRALNLYILGSFVPFIVKSALIGGLVYGAGGLTVVFSIFVQIGFGRSLHGALRQTLIVARQNVRLAEALRVERDAVQTTMRAKDLFLAGVTHDLRQPVHALSLHLRYLRQLRDDELSPAALAGLCTPMDAALRTMSGQLTRLLELSRLEAGEARVTRRPIALAEVARTLEAQFTAQAHDKGLQLRLRLPADVMVDSDAQMLLSIVGNLVANAVRYTERGGVLVAARRRAGGVQFLVADTGAGIAADVLPQIFIAYRRFDDRQRGRDDGQGLGLALARKQAELLGHTLAVRSVPGRGSVFTLAVPAAAAPSA